MTEAEAKPNWFVRVLIVLLCLALFTLVYVSFFAATPRYVISAGMITLVALIVVLALSESFNQLSIGTLLSLRREVARQEEEKRAVKSENQELRSELVRVMTTVSQSQVNNTLVGTPEALLRALGVVPAEPTAEDDAERQAAEEACVEQPPTQGRVEGPSRWQRLRAAERIATTKYLAALDLPESEVLTEVEFSAGFRGIDPVMDRRITFDAYARGAGHERFFEFRPVTAVSPMFFDRLYVMLSKVHLYAMAKRIRADLVLVLIDLPEEPDTGRWYPTERLFEWFEPAVVNRLLRIERIAVSAEEIAAELEGGA
ncbi:hypothetical protein FDZ71_00005 [bacterium]|nr:MAG: hypothetical protein FDZ71_00005 [bacterium]